MLLAGDVGGTKTALGIFSQESGPRAPLAHASYASGDGESLAALVRRFLATNELPIDRACFAVAGPVLDGRTKITNLPWVLDERGLAEELGLESVRLINDLEAIARAIPTLTPGDLHTLNQGTPADRGAIAVIAPGTGLGEAFLTWDSFRFVPHPSEGGHGDFAPNSPLEIGLLYFALDDVEEGFNWAERAFQDRSYELISINVDPRLEPFKGDARLQRLVSQLGLP